MPVLLAPILIAFLAVASAIVCLVLMNTASVWLRPIIKALTANHHNFWVKVLTAPLKLVGKGVLQVQHTVTASLSHFVGASLKPLTGWLNAMATVERETVLHISGLAKATYDAFNILRHTVIPGLIRAAVNPVNVIATRADKLSKATDAQIDAITANFGRALSTAGFGAWATLNNQLVGFARAMDNLHEQVWRNVVPDLTALKNEVFNKIGTRLAIIEEGLNFTIPGQIGNLRARLGAIESALASLGDVVIDVPGDIGIPNLDAFKQQLADALAKLKELSDPAALALAAVAAVTAFAPQLFCRNTLKTAEKLCGANDDLLENLLLGLTLATAAISLEELIEAAQGFTDDVVAALDYVT